MTSDSTGMDASRSLPTLTPATYEAVCGMMAEEGVKPADDQQVSAYVQKLIAKESFFRNVDRIQARNRGVDPDEVQATVDKAVEEVRTERGKRGPGARRS